VETHASITQHRKQVEEHTAEAEAGKGQHLDVLGSFAAVARIRTNEHPNVLRGKVDRGNVAQIHMVQIR
jgi:hypothetical protein